MAFLAVGVVSGLVIASAIWFGIVLEFLHDNDTLRSAVEEWAEAERTIPRTGTADVSAYRRFERAEEALHALAEDLD